LLTLLLLVALSSPLLSRTYFYIDSAKKYLYVREVKPNRSPEIDRWNRYVNNGYGSAYCGAFTGSMIKGVKHPLVKAGLARNYYTLAKKEYRFTAEDVYNHKAFVKKGDLVVWRRGSTIFGHIGIAIADWKYMSGWTIEGNTSSGTGSQYDGDGVFKRYRTIHLYDFFRIAYFVRVIE
jgi:hypothetical protein